MRSARRHGDVAGVARVAGRLIKDAYLLTGAGCFFYLSFVLADVAVDHAWSAWTVGPTLLLLPGLVLAWLRFSEAGRRSLAYLLTTRAVALLILGAALVAPATAGFATVGSAMYVRGVGRFADHPPAAVVFSRTYESFMWHLFDAVPLLKIPETLHWKLAHPFLDHAQGALVLVYKVVVLVPLLYMIGLLVQQWRSPD